MEDICGFCEKCKIIISSLSKNPVSLVLQTKSALLNVKIREIKLSMLRNGKNVWAWAWLDRERNVQGPVLIKKEGLTFYLFVSTLDPLCFLYK